MLRMHVHQNQRLRNHPLLDTLIERGVGCERRRMVYLEYKWFALRIKHNIQAQNLESHAVCRIVRLTGFVEVSEGWLGGAQRLYDHVVDAIFQFLGIVTERFEIIVCGVQASLVTDVIFLNAFILHKSWIALIHRIICQVHLHIPHIFTRWNFVFNCRKSRQPIFMDENSERVASRNKHINPQIELELINKHRPLDILLYYIVLLTRVNLLDTFRKKNSAALAGGLRLHDENLVPHRPELFSELRVL
jgi:hypothetical protein